MNEELELQECMDFFKKILNENETISITNKTVLNENELTLTGNKSTSNDFIIEIPEDILENEEENVKGFWDFAKNIWSKKMDYNLSKETWLNLTKSISNISSAAILVNSKVFPFMVLPLRAAQCITNTGIGLISGVQERIHAGTSNENENTSNINKLELAKLAAIASGAILVGLELYAINEENWEENDSTSENIKDVFFTDITTWFTTELMITSAKTTAQLFNVISKQMGYNSENSSLDKCVNFINKASDAVSPVLIAGGLYKIGEEILNQPGSSNQAEAISGIAVGTIPIAISSYETIFKPSINYLKSVYDKNLSNNHEQTDNHEQMANNTEEEGMYNERL